jgi:hypothetical protein
MRTFLDNRHPDYVRMAVNWQFWRESYEGGATYLQGGHLFRFPRETESNYTERLKRAARLNFTRQVVDLLVQYVRKESPARRMESASEAIQAFWRDVDRQGRTIDDFMGSVALMTALFGRAYVVVDKPAAGAVNRLDQGQRRLNPYAYTLSPLDVLDTVRDECESELTQALVREYVRGPVNLSEARERDGLTERFRLWLKTDEGVVWRLFHRGEDGQPREVDGGVLPLQRLPIVEVQRSDGSLAEEIATLDRKVFNYESLLDQILYEQTFSTLRLPWNGRMEEFYDQWELTLGTKSILPYDPTSGAAPDFIAPDARQGDLVLKAIEQSVANIYRVKNLLDALGGIQPGQSPVSGIARGYDFEKLNAGLSAFADDLEKAERELAMLVNAWEGEEETVPPDLVDYPDTFDVKTLLQELDEYRQLAQSVHSETFQRHLQKRLVLKSAPKLSPSDSNRIMAELDAGNNIKKAN